MVFVDRPVSAAFVGLSVLLVGVQVFAWLRRGGARMVPAPDMHA